MLAYRQFSHNQGNFTPVWRLFQTNWTYRFSHHSKGAKVPISVSFSNQQKYLKVSKKVWQAKFDKLAAAIIRNLQSDPPAHLKKKWLAKVADRGLFNVVFVTNEQIQELNRQWRSKDAPTDVLSFPMDADEPPEGEPWELGDVIISVERADEQAQDYGHSLERELCFLFVHGALHVLGFDHETKKEEKEMFGRQAEVLDSLGIGRD